MSFDFSFIKRHKKIWHLVFWLAYLLFFTFQYGYNRSEYLKIFLQYLCFLPLVMSATYFYIYYLIPKYLLEKKYPLFFTFAFSSGLIFIVLLRLITKFLIPVLFFSPEIQKALSGVSFFHPIYLISHFVSIYSAVISAAFVKLLMHWYDEEGRAQQLKKEKLEAELKFLKAQIHPHFLFNLLNNIYGLSLANSPKTPELILKLSSLLNYILYECNVPLVSLDKEIELLKDYISLEKIRYGERLSISFNVIGNTGGIKIAPLLLFPFVENSFKHGASNEPDDSWIEINLEVNPNQLILSVKNSYTHAAESEQSGIGLQNVKRQLELLYKDKHILNFEIVDSVYSVKLILESEGNKYAD